jgi:hypothetical protein
MTGVNEDFLRVGLGKANVGGESSSELFWRCDVVGWRGSRSPMEGSGDRTS